jgi:ATP phosphoribosyltransferase
VEYYKEFDKEIDKLVEEYDKAIEERRKRDAVFRVPRRQLKKKKLDFDSVQ